MVLLWRRDVFIVICKTLRGVQTPSKARPDGCIGIGYSDLEINGIFLDIFLETCDHTHGMKWDTVHIIWRLWIEPIILLKSNRYIKCFCQPECCQYKILTNSPFGYSGTKKYLTGLEIHSRSKTKNTPPFCLKRTKGKQSIREKPQLLKFITTRLIVKCLIKNSNYHKRKPKNLKISHFLNLSHFGFLLLKPGNHRLKIFSHLSLLARNWSSVERNPTYKLSGRW
jgi:hypothetical protein